MIERLVELGILPPLAWLLTFTIYYKLLEKSKLFGESRAVNLTIALVAAFLTSIALVAYLAVFFFLVWIAAFTLGIGLLIAGFFFPKLSKALMERMKSPAALGVMVVLVLAISLISLFIVGLPKVLFPGMPPIVFPPDPILLTLLFFLVFGLSLLLLLMLKR